MIFLRRENLLAMKNSVLKRLSALYLVISFFAFFWVLFSLYEPIKSQTKFPDKPITLVVHSKPGSGIDLLARVVADIASRKYGTTMVVENRSGSQGVAAMEHVLSQKSDGYTVLAVTKSFISTLLVSKSHIELSRFSFLAKMMRDAEVLIVNSRSAVRTVADIIDDARKVDGKQLWIGAGTGSRDHLMAIKTWKALGIRAEWLDYKSAPQATLAMLRQEGKVTIGNPSDVDGRADLEIAAIAHDTRLPKFPNAPTLRELGFPLEEYMWRGFAVRNDVPEHVAIVLENLFLRISHDDEFKKYLSDQSAFPGLEGRKEFSRSVEAEIRETNQLLVDSGVLRNYKKKGPLSNATVFGLGFFVFFAALWLLTKLAKKPFSGTLVLANIFVTLSAYIYYETSLYLIPADVHVTNPALIPRLWAGFLGAFSLLLVAKELFGKNSAVEHAKEMPPWRLLASVILTCLFYSIVPFWGFYLATFFFLLAIIRILRGSNWYWNFVAATNFVVGCYIVFNRVLNVELPKGISANWL